MTIESHDRGEVQQCVASIRIFHQHYINTRRPSHAIAAALSPRRQELPRRAMLM